MITAPAPGDDLVYVTPVRRTRGYLFHVARDQSVRVNTTVSRVTTLCGYTYTRVSTFPDTQVVGSHECKDCRQIVGDVALGKRPWPGTENPA